MKRVRFKTPFNYKKSAITGITRDHWLEAFYTLEKGIIDNASPECARQRIPGPRSHHGLLADELEGFTRSFIMAGPWLSGSSNGIFNIVGESIDVADFYRRGILAGTNPANPEYWGDITDYAQHLVEMASLGWSLYLSKNIIWDSFTTKEKRQVADYLYSCTKVKYHRNNWLLFNVVTNSVLKKLEMPYSQKQIDENINFCDSMYLGNGWYRDGNVNRIDYYNAWAFHYYYLIWALLDGDSKPEIAEKHRERVNDLFKNFVYFVSGDGSVPVFGRSMIYRFAYLAPFVLAEKLGYLNAKPGLVRNLCSSTFKFFFSHEILTDDNFLSMGFLTPCAEMLEHYSCGGSPYWAAKAFNIFLIDKNDPFWTDNEEKLPIQKGDYSVSVKEAGLILIGNSTTGHVQLINQKSRHDNPEYNAKYTKFAYSSVFSYEARKIYNNYNCDNVLEFSEDGIKFEQRWKMDTLYLEDTFSASRYSLHNVDEDGKATTYIIARDDFLINVHYIEPTKNLIYREGGYALGYDNGKHETASIKNAELASIDGKITFIRNLYGYNRQFKAAPFADDVSGSNVRYRFSVMPALGYVTNNAGLTAGGEKLILASMVYGKIGSDSIEQLFLLVNSFTVEGRIVRLSFYDGEEIFMQLGTPDKVEVKLGGSEFTGRFVIIRVSPEGRPVLVIEA